VNTDRVDGFPGNFIRTKELEALGLEKGLIEEILTKNKRIKRFISLSRAARALFGSTDSKASYKTVYSAGHGVGLIDKVLSIQEIMEITVKEYKKIKAQLP
ncbi:MAG: hypothetical protein OER74_16865, partial [Desulfobacteraceae bacterium]|nr:hypothetical protein [Desulfobacteraceae bacterium]